MTSNIIYISPHLLVLKYVLLKIKMEFDLTPILSYRKTGRAFILMELQYSCCYTVDAGYKHIVGNCINVLITGINYIGIYGNRFQYSVLISDMFL